MRVVAKRKLRGEVKLSEMAGLVIGVPGGKLDAPGNLHRDSALGLSRYLSISFRSSDRHCHGTVILRHTLYLVIRFASQYPVG